jgi:hypothetical protein
MATPVISRYRDVRYSHEYDTGNDVARRLPEDARGSNSGDAYACVGVGRVGLGGDVGLVVMGVVATDL